MLVDRGMVAAVRKEIDQHRNRQRLVEDRVLRVHVGASRQRVERDDRHELTGHQINYLRQQFRMFQLVAVKSLHELLAPVHDELLGQRLRAEPFEGARVELERALIFELVEDVRLDLRDRTLDVDEVIVIELPQRRERGPRLFLEHLIAPANELLGQISGSQLDGGANARFGDLAIVVRNLATPAQLPGDAGPFADEQHHDVNGRPAEMNRQRRLRELVVQFADPVDEQLQTLDLHRRARETIEHHSVAVDRLEQLPEQHRHHLFVGNHSSLRLDALHLWRRQQITHDDRRACEAAHLIDERRLRPLPRTRSPAEQDDLLRESEMLATDLALETFPDGCEDQAGVLDFEIDDARRWISWRCGHGIDWRFGGCHALNLRMQRVHNQGPP